MTDAKTTPFGCGLIDFDNHYYEPDDCFTRYIGREHLDVAINIRRGDDGLGRVYFGDDPYRWFRVTQTDYIAAPGALREYFDGGEVKPTQAAHLIAPREFPAYLESRPRLELMDEQGVDATVMLPSLGVSVIGAISSSVEAAYRNVVSFNRWLAEDWGFATENRIFGVPLMVLLDPEQSVAELDRVLASGARMVLLVPRPAGTRSPADPVFDPFWARLSEAGVPLALHAGDSGFQHLYALHWGEDPNVPVHHFSPLQHFLAMSERPIVDTLAAITLHNLFGRFPSLKVISIENGSTWLPSLLKNLDKAYGANRTHRTLGGVLPGRPSEALRRSLYVSPFPEDDLGSLVEALGADRVLMGSDFPHPEGMRAPGDFAGRVAHLDPAVQRQILHDNAAALLGLAPAPA